MGAGCGTCESALFSGSSTLDCEQPPGSRHTFQLVIPSVVDGDTGPGNPCGHARARRPASARPRRHARHRQHPSERHPGARLPGAPLLRARHLQRDRQHPPGRPGVPGPRRLGAGRGLHHRLPLRPSRPGARRPGPRPFHRGGRHRRPPTTAEPRPPASRSISVARRRNGAVSRRQAARRSSPRDGGGSGRAR